MQAAETAEGKRCSLFVVNNIRKPRVGRTQLRWFACRSLLGLLLATPVSRAQSPVHIDVDLAKSAGKFTPIYSCVGYDESGYTVTPNGKELLGQLHDLSPVPVYVRAHFLLATGEDKPDLKWSSSNVYT